MRKILFGLILIFLFAVLSSNNFAFAKKLELTDKDIEAIFDAIKTFGSIVLPEGQLKSALNTTVRGVDMGADITYGLLALSAANEMEFIDMVVSQRYKREADKFFNSVLNRHLNLFSYYKGVGLDIPKVLSGKITGSVPALFVLNTFDITDKTLNIFIAIDVLRKVKTYDALWTYFDYRRNGESHKIAWEDASFVGGWALQSLKKRSVFDRDDTNDDSNQQLELQFAQLWDKWGQHTTAFGVTQEAKQRFSEEMRGLVAQAIEAESLADKNVNLSLLGRIQSVVVSLAQSIKRSSVEVVGVVADGVHALTKNIISSVEKIISLGGASLVLDMSQDKNSILGLVSEPAENLAKLSIVQESIESQIVVDEVRTLNLSPAQQEMVKQEIVELRGVLTQIKYEIEQEEILKHPEILSQAKDEAKLNLVKDETESEGILNQVKDELNEIKLQEVCEAGPTTATALGDVVINEVAWMGTPNSANEEWIVPQTAFPYS